MPLEGHMKTELLIYHGFSPPCALKYDLQPNSLGIGLKAFIQSSRQVLKSPKLEYLHDISSSVSLGAQTGTTQK